MIHKHDASRLHFDLRLEHAGVLVCWAVPRGLSTDPSRRLAVRTEDHPVKYLSFEGMIPKGQYGAGPMIVWDRGKWTSDQPLDQGLAAGKVKITLDGLRLHGRWTLVRTGGRDSKQWLAIYDRSGPGGARDDDASVSEQTSVDSGRTLEDVRLGKPPAKRRSKTQSSRRAGPGFDTLPTIALKLPSLVDRPPNGSEWIHELKLDGYRMQIRLAGGKVRLLTRNGHDWTERLPETADAVASVSADSAVFDGELVALDRSGITDFSSLQSAFSHGRTGKLVLFLFDLMFLNGESLTERPLIKRKALLEPLVRAAGPRLQYLDHLSGSPEPLLEACRRRGLEGIVSKRGDRPYRGGRARDWVKTKFRRRERFVVGGVEWSNDAVAGIGSLAVGYYRPSGDLVGCGKVGGGWSQTAGTRLAEQLRALVRRSCPFAENVPAATKPRSKPTWVEPTLVVEVAFAGVTAEGNLRHASLVGVEANLPAASTTRDSISDDIAPGDFDASPPAGERPQNESAGNRRNRRVSSNGRGASMLQSIGDVKVTTPERILFPDSGITKLDLIEYFVQVSHWLLPHVRDRVVSLVRCPSGIGGEKFFQRHPLRGMPESIRSVVPADEKRELLTIDSAEGLIAAAQMNVIELHPWGSRIDRPDRPDRIVFDLDPDPAVPWQDVTAAAWMIGRQLERRGLTTFVKTTGGKGLHLVVPVVRRYGWDKVSQWCSDFVDELVAAEPKRFTGNQSKRARRGRIFIDHHRNRRGSTSVAAYCVRARPGAPVSVPIRWEELSSLKDPAPWTLRNLPQRLKSLREDPWAGIETVRQYLK